MTFDKIQSPQQLMQFLDDNISYGVIDNNGVIYNDSGSGDFQRVCDNEWKLLDAKHIIDQKIGHCYDQVEVEREWFETNGYNYKTIWVCTYQHDIPNSGFSHSYLIYQEDNKWCLFEHADYYNKGIYEFYSMQEAVKYQASNQIAYATRCIKPDDKYSLCIKVFDKPPVGCNMQEYLAYIDSCADFDI